MSIPIDALDRKILVQLQQNANQNLESIADKIGSSRTPVWNRIKKLHRAGIIKRTVAVLDAEKLGFQGCFFVLVRTSEHEKEWQNRFLEAVQARPEVQEAHRLAGEIDYILKVRVPDARTYDVFYQALIADVKVFNVTAMLSMQAIKETTALPLSEAG